MDVVYYEGAHSATFGDKNTWTDWHLIPTSKPVISPPTVKIKQVEIPGAHGNLDLSTILTGYPTYNNRTGTLDYVLAPGFEYWENAKAVIMSHLQGRTMNLYLQDDPDHYWVGMFYVNSLKSDARTNGISINYDLYPFRRDILQSDEEWLWDPFNFEIGKIKNWGSLRVDGSLQIDISDCQEPVSPTFTCSSAMTLTHGWKAADGSTKTKVYSLPAGASTPTLTLKPSLNTLVINGNGTVGIRYRGGIL